MITRTDLNTTIKTLTELRNDAMLESSEGSQMIADNITNYPDETREIIDALDAEAALMTKMIALLLYTETDGETMCRAAAYEAKRDA
jgi:hypothetical protein